MIEKLVQIILILSSFLTICFGLNQCVKNNELNCNSNIKEIEILLNSNSSEARLILLKKFHLDTTSSFVYMEKNK